MGACFSDVPVVDGEDVMDWLEGDDLLEEGE